MDRPKFYDARDILREGEVYDYPYSIPNAQQISPADVLVCYRAQREAVGGQRIFGVGRVDKIVPDGDRILAVYDRYVALKPARSFDNIGGDPRNNRRNAINALDVEIVQTLLQAFGLSSIEDAEHIETDIEDLQEIGTGPGEEVVAIED